MILLQGRGISSPVTRTKQGGFMMVEWIDWTSTGEEELDCIQTWSEACEEVTTVSADIDAHLTVIVYPLTFCRGFAIPSIHRHYGVIPSHRTTELENARFSRPQAHTIAHPWLRSFPPVLRTLET